MKKAIFLSLIISIGFTFAVAPKGVDKEYTQKRAKLNRLLGEADQSGNTVGQHLSDGDALADNVKQFIDRNAGAVNDDGTKND